MTHGCCKRGFRKGFAKKTGGPLRAAPVVFFVLFFIIFFAFFFVPYRRAPPFCLRLLPYAS
jgi:hypothetical protein